MATVHEVAANALLEYWQSEPVGRAIIEEVKQGLEEKRWGKSYMRTIGYCFRRPSSPKGWPLHQLAAFMWVHSRVDLGLTGHAAIQVGSRPGPDEDRTGNAAKLLDLPGPFHATVNMTQNCATEGDGILEWTEPIEVAVSSGLFRAESPGLKSPVNLFLTVAPGRLPLEIGKSLPSRTMLHLREDGGVARWPYAEEDIRILVNVDGYRPGRALSEYWLARQGKS